VLGPGGFITKPRNQMHAMWNAGDKPGRILEVIAPGGFASYFRGLGELLADMTPSPGRALDETEEFAALASRYGLAYGNPDWLDDIVARYSLTPPNHQTAQAGLRAMTMRPKSVLAIRSSSKPAVTASSASCSAVGANQAPRP
jgi:hypothetical protein